MIEVGVVEFLTWFAVGGLLMVIGTWIGFRLIGLRRGFKKKRQRIRCRLCQLRYLNLEESELSHCPNCGGLNEFGGQRRL